MGRLRRREMRRVLTVGWFLVFALLRWFNWVVCHRRCRCRHRVSSVMASGVGGVCSVVSVFGCGRNFLETVHNRTEQRSRDLVVGVYFMVVAGTSMCPTDPT